MTDGHTDPTRVHSNVNIPVPVAPLPGLFLPGHAGAEMDNVYTSSVPQGVVADAGDAGASTEWDAATLDDAIRWLNATGKWLNDLSVGMVDIQELMTGSGNGSGKSPMGTFTWAQTLSQKHAGLYSSTELKVKQLSEELYSAARALQNIKDNYDRAEERNALNATDMNQIFTDAARRLQA